MMRKYNHTSFGRKHHKLFLPVGLLSLGVIPIIFLILLNNSKDYLSQRILPLVFIDLNNSPPSLESFRNYVFNKKYTHFYLTTNDQKNGAIFNAAATKIKQLVQTGDTINGVHFYIPDEAQFNLFIEVIDLCKCLKAEIYLPHDNDIWIMNSIPEKQTNTEGFMFICSTTSQIIPPDPIILEKELKRKSKEQLDYIFQTAWTFKFPILLFVMMMIINIRKIVQYTNYS